MTDVQVSELEISVQRPASMSESELRAWVLERARTSRLALTLGQRVDSDGPRLLSVGTSIPPDVATEQIDDLMLDMRLIGLRPEVIYMIIGAGSRLSTPDDREDG